MNKLKKLVTLCICCAMAACFIATPVAKASITEVPTITFNFSDKVNPIYDEFYMGGEYSNFKFEPLGNGTLTFKFDAECPLPKNTRYSISLVDGITHKIVETRYIYAINNQYLTFKNLNSYNYYIKFGGNDDIMGMMYLSKTGIFN